MSNDDRRYPVDRTDEFHGVVPLRQQNPSNLLYPTEFGYDEPQKDGFDFWSIIRIVLSRKWMISAITIAGMAMAIALTLQVTPMYAATATMEIQRPEAPIIEGSNLGSQVVAGEEDKETLYRLLRSRFLAERIVEELNLANDERYADPNLPRDRRVLQAARRIVGSLRVSPVGRSRVVSVTYMSEYRGETARIANAVVESFIQSNLERSYNTTAFAREFLDDIWLWNPR